MAKLNRKQSGVKQQEEGQVRVEKESAKEKVNTGRQRKIRGSKWKRYEGLRGKFWRKEKWKSIIKVTKVK